VLLPANAALLSRLADNNSIDEYFMTKLRWIGGAILTCAEERRKHSSMKGVKFFSFPN